MFNDVERLAFAQAVFKASGEIVSTKDPSNLRAAVDKHYRDLYEQTGAKSFEVRLNDEKVGTYSVKVSKATKEDTKQRLEVKDPEALLAWLEGTDDLLRYIKAHAVEFAQEHFLRTGEIPDGCTMSEVVIPAQEEAYAGGSIRIDPQKVAEALGAQLPDAMNALMLEGGNDDR